MPCPAVDWVKRAVAPERQWRAVAIERGKMPSLSLRDRLTTFRGHSAALAARVRRGWSDERHTHVPAKLGEEVYCNAGVHAALH